MSEIVEVPVFEGFVEPQENWSKLPHQLIGALPYFGTKAEIVVVLYILRHTWGFNDDGKKITLDEFENGRWMKNRETGEYERMDDGVGMTRPSIVKGLKDAAKHGFIETVVDKSDKGRVKKFYSLKGQGLKNFTPDVKEFNPRGKNPLHRSEKETIERNSEKEHKDSVAPIATVDTQPASPTIAATSAAQSEKPLNPIVIEQINEAVAAGDARPMPLKAKKSKQPDKPKEPAKPRERDRLFDGVAFTCFEVDMNKLKTPLNKNTAKRIGVLVSWLKENEYTPEQLWDFARWYKGTYPDISMPRDAGKLELHWLKWEQSGQPKVTALAALPEYDPTNDPTYRAIPPEQRVDASTIAQRIGARYGKSGL